MTDTWSIVQNGYDPATARAYEGLFTIGSGYLHIRGSLEEHLHGAPQNVDFVRRPGNTTAETFADAPAKWGTYVPGVIGHHPTMLNEMVNLPWPLWLVPIVDGERLDVSRCDVSTFIRMLDLHTASIRRSLRWSTRSGATVDLTTEWFASAARPHLLLQRLTLSADTDVKAAVEAGIDTDVRTNGFDHLEVSALEVHGQDTVACSVRTDLAHEVHMLSRLEMEDAAFSQDINDRAASVCGQLHLAAGDTLVAEKRTAVTTSRDQVPTTPEEQLAAVLAEDFDALFDEQRAVWSQRWQECDVEIDGDDESQLALRTSVFHLLRAHVPDSRVAIGAKGHAGDAYRGNFFWDTEMYLLPFYLYTCPHRARSLMEFRLNTLEGAKRLAESLGYRGARYPWISDPEGNECCPSWQYRDHEIHVTAAVAYGLLHYAAATGEEDFLQGSAAEALVETGRYWLDRTDQRPGDEHLSLLGVMGPDEYTPICNNNSYTNRMVSLALTAAARYGLAGGADDELCRNFRSAADRLGILVHDNGLVLQCEEFQTYAEPDFERFWTDRSKPFGACVSQERIYRTKCLKQADVLMLMMLFPGDFSDNEVRQAWDYYLPYTTHDSSLSAGVHAIVASRLGLREQAWEFFQAGAYKDLEFKCGGAAEGIHIAGCGANWVVVTYGFAGLVPAMQDKRLTLTPALPEAWQRLAFRAIWKNVPVKVEIEPDRTTLTNLGDGELETRVWGREATIAAGDEKTFTRPGSE
ncbi:MAG: glycosyl hydrolase family 65 protein [Phycisphaerae bacterium]